MPRIGSQDKVVVLGAGLCGLSAARLLAREGVEVVVLEAEERVGGLARTLERSGCRVDIGSHRLHPDAFRGELLSWLNELCGDILKARPRHGLLRLYGRYIDYPPSLFGLLKSLGSRRVIRCIRSLLEERINPTCFEGAASFESRIVEKVGYEAYRIFYRPYAVKVWGEDPRTISVDEVKKRVITANPLLAFRDVLKRFFRLGEDSEPAYLYPEGGIGMIARRLREEIEQHGGRVITGARLLELGHDENKLVNRVSYEFKGEVTSVPAGAVLSTISPHDLSALLRVDLPGEVQGALERLRWRGMRLLYWESPGLRHPDCETYYFPETDYPFGRISVPALFDSSMGCRKSDRLLCIELPCGEDEEIWSSTDNSLFSLLNSGLRQAGVIAGEGREETPGTIFSVKERRIYPLLFVNWRDYFSIVYSWLRTHPNLFPLGRQGLFLHNNMDQSIVMGRNWARNYLEQRLDNGAWDESIWDWSNWKIRD